MSLCKITHRSCAYKRAMFARGACPAAVRKHIATDTGRRTCAVWRVSRGSLLLVLGAFLGPLFHFLTQRIETFQNKEQFKNFEARSLGGGEGGSREN